MAIEPGVLATFWRRDKSGHWFLDGLKGLIFPPRPGESADFFRLQGPQPLPPVLTRGSMQEFFATFGNAEFLMKQRILPVVGWVDGERSMRCLGTAFAISCSGYLITACHVLLDPRESGYGEVRLQGNTLTYGENINVGVIIPRNPAYGELKFNFYPFRRSRFWGDWENSPLLHEEARFRGVSDVAVCKIDESIDGIAHQPLNLSLRPFKVGDFAMAIGYAEMKDIPFQIDSSGHIQLDPFVSDLYVPIGEVVEVLSDNHLTRRVPTPGPCFDFRARIPGRMSGAPIFDIEGRVVRGVVSRSFSGEKHAFGALLSPVVDLQIVDRATLREMMGALAEGMPKLAV